MISAVDEKANTFTIAGKQKSRTFKISNRTVITKAGNVATMKDVVANEEARGSYWKMADGSLEVKTLKVGPLTDAEKAAEEKRKERRAAKKAAGGGATSPSPAGSASPAASPSASPSGR
jgi:transcriptional regulator of nitric oxide reductase